MLTSDTRASTLRVAFRACLAVATAFGLKWSAEQVAIVQVAAEAVLQAARAWHTKAI